MMSDPGGTSTLSSVLFRYWIVAMTAPEVPLPSRLGDLRVCLREWSDDAALALRDALAAELGDGDTALVDLPELGAELLDPGSARRADALATTAGADLLVVASPTVQGDLHRPAEALRRRLGASPLTGTYAVGLMVGAGPGHALAIDAHLTPLLLELGASCPWRGLYVLESELPALPERARDWAAGAAALIPRG